MSLKSDITIDVSKFDPKSITDSTHALNGHLMDLMKGAPKWYEVLLSLPCPHASVHCPDQGLCRWAPRNTGKCAQTARHRFQCE